ncbi:hypothetical protein KJ359_001614 [Pestalotiopsis sp. 9143b]|nr:hypothetical protein KJ359_001614 [Pestalotiopsis sp. 9143b]
MAPFAGAYHLLRDAVQAGPDPVSSYLRTQWNNPSDILSVLFLLGPEVVRAAVAQQTGRFITPVSFSFGWAAYAASAALSAVGDGLFMPNADTSNVMLIEVKSGHYAITRTWVLGRLMRDLSDKLDTTRLGGKEIPGRIRATGKQKVSPTDPSPELQPLESLRVVLALIGGSLPQWRKEKWATKKGGGPTVALTTGVGSRQVIVILGREKVGLDLSILANQTALPQSQDWNRDQELGIYSGSDC